jgi:predicted nucleotidyltransferase
MPADNARTRLEEHFRAHPDGLVCAWLFGSVARGTAGARSDVDVAVLLERAPAPTLAGLEGELATAIERHLGARVDLVVANRAPVDLVHRILRDGVLVLDRLPLERARFEARSRSAYFDLKPFLDRYRRVPGSTARG